MPLAEMDDIEIEALIGEEGGSLAGVFGPLPNVAAEVDASASQSCVAPDDDDASAPHLHRGNGDEGPSAASSAQPPSVHDVGGDEDAHVDRGLRGKGEVSAFFHMEKLHTMPRTRGSKRSADSARAMATSRCAGSHELAAGTSDGRTKVAPSD